MSSASFMAMAFLDRVKQIIDTLRNADLLSQSTVLIVSDHGFRKVDHALHPLVMLKEADASKSRQKAGDIPLMGNVLVIPEGGTASIYISNSGNRRKLLRQVYALFSSADGVDKVLTSEEFSKMGWPVVSQTDQAPDLLLTAKPGYS